MVDEVMLRRKSEKGESEMDVCVQQVIDKKVERAIKSFKKHHINPYFVQTNQEALELIKSMIEKGSKIGVGGSMTLAEIGLLDELRSGNYQFIDTQESSLSYEERHDRYRECFLADYYVSSSNAITEDGFLYNVDGRNNRIAAMLYGPNQVIIVVGVNKIVRNLDEAVLRNREISAPANAIRLARKTPCAVKGTCQDCQSPERICRNYVVMGPQMNPERIHLIIVNGVLGF